MWSGCNIDQGPANLPFVIIIIIILHASNPLHVTCHRQKDIWDIILSPHLQQSGCHFVPWLMTEFIHLHCNTPRHSITQTLILPRSLPTSLELSVGGKGF
jgi:hypothetical protein